MKQIFVILGAFLMVSMTAVQAQKVAHINYAELIESMPEKAKADSDFEAFAKAIGDDIKKQDETLQADFDAWRKKWEGKSQAELEQNRATIEAEQQGFQTRGAKLDEIRTEAQKKLNKKQSELLDPIIKKAETAITKVATAKGIDYVFDISTGGVMVIKGVDLLGDVKKEMGISL